MSRNDIDLAAFHERLLERQREIRALADLGSEGAKPVELDQQAVGRVSRIDAMQLQAMALATQERRRADIARIEQALARLRSGDYGYCVKCDEAIERKRLEFDPATPMCFACAAGAER